MNEVKIQNPEQGRHYDIGFDYGYYDARDGFGYGNTELDGENQYFIQGYKDGYQEYQNEQGEELEDN